MRHSGKLLRVQVGDAFDLLHDRPDFLGDAGQFVEVRTEHFHAEVRGRSTQAFIDSHAQRCREQDGDSGDHLQFFPHCIFESVERTGAVGLKDHQHIGSRMGHGVFGTLGAPGASDHVLDFRKCSKHIFDFAVRAIHLVERSLGRKHRLNQKCSFIQLRHEV